jgi:hypothetical protein
MSEDDLIFHSLTRHSNYLVERLGSDNGLFIPYVSSSKIRHDCGSKIIGVSERRTIKA